MPFVEEVSTSWTKMPKVNAFWEKIQDELWAETLEQTSKQFILTIDTSINL